MSIQPRNPISLVAEALEDNPGTILTARFAAHLPHRDHDLTSQTEDLDATLEGILWNHPDQVKVEETD